MTPEKLTVSLGDRSYDIHIGKDLRGAFGEWLSAVRGGAGVFVVTDRNVAAIYGEDIGRWMGDAPHAVFAMEPGEARKTWETVRDIYAFLARGAGGMPNGADRDSIVVAFGGGVVGDLAGFAAATYLRGIRYVQVPTTLLAQVDSSVGGKTAFNLPEGKNLAGAFHQPRAVFIDRSFLLTLDDRNLRAGMAEVVKCALAGDAALWTLLLDHGARWKAMTDRDWGALVRAAVAFKAWVVERDEKETSTRRILNLGHTVGHALERAAGYGRFLHGEAVAIGLAWEAVFASRMGFTPPELADQVCLLLGEMGFVLDDAGVPTQAIVAALSADKKRIDSDLDMPMVTAPGQCALRRVPAARLGRDLAEVRDEVRERARMPGLAPAATLPERAEGPGRGAAVPPEERDLLERIARGEGEAVVAALEKKVATDPRDVPSIVLLASAYRRLGNSAAAWEMIKEALAQRPSDARAQRVAREIERDGGGAPGKGRERPAPPLEDVILLDEEKFELTAADLTSAAPGGGEAPAQAAPPGETATRAPVEPAPGASLVRTITMADVFWAQGRLAEARGIVDAILRNEPANARALAWRAAHGPNAGEEGADAVARKLSSLLETIAKEYGYDISRPL